MSAIIRGGTLWRHAIFARISDALLDVPGITAALLYEFEQRLQLGGVRTIKHELLTGKREKTG
jgi:hypothetical protein